MADDNLATVPIRELITSFRKQIEDLPIEKLIDKLFLSTITNRLEAQADEIDALSAENHLLTERYQDG